MHVEMSGLSFEMEVREGIWDAGIIHEVATHPLYQEALSLVKAGDFVLDIGAHIGSFTIPCALKGAQVTAVEASPFNAEMLRRNIALNGVKVHVHEAALWKEVGTHAFTYNEDNTGASGFYQHQFGKNIIEVPTITLESLVGSREVNLIKMDIEGAEWGVLESCRSLPCQYFLMEYHGMGARDLPEMQTLLADLGFVKQKLEECVPTLGCILAERT